MQFAQSNTQAKIAKELFFANTQYCTETKMDSNTTITHFLTIGYNPFKVFFIYQKCVEDYFPSSNLYWYPKRGDNGDAKWVWQDKKIKQWSFATKDKVAIKWGKELIGNTNIKQKIGSKELDFELLPHDLTSVSNNYDIDNIPKLIENSVLEVKYAVEIPELSFLVDESDNIDFLEGYKTHDKISPILPSNFFEEGFLKERIVSKTILYQIRRNIRFGFRGNRFNVDENKDTKELNGKCYEKSDFLTNHSVVVLDENKNNIGEANFDLGNGEWTLYSSQSLSKGYIAIKNNISLDYVYASRFVLLKGINLKTSIGSNDSIIDAFGRTSYLSSNNKPKDFLNEAYAWEQSYFLDSIDSYKKLHDILEKMFYSLGKRIVLNDPYAFGITSFKDGQIQGNDSHNYFFSALKSAILKYKIEEIIIICRWDNAKTDFSSSNNIESKERFSEIYNFIAKSFIVNDSKYDSLKSLKIAFPKEKFHDRFWAGLNSDNSISRIYHISSSVSAYFENNELLISPITGSVHNKISPKILRRLSPETIKDVLNENI